MRLGKLQREIFVLLPPEMQLSLAYIRKNAHSSLLHFVIPA